MEKYDVVVVGAGPAGWSAATFLARAGMSVSVIGKEEESGLYFAADVRNFPGFPGGVSGKMLLQNMSAQAKEQGVEYAKKEITHIAERGNEFIVKTADLNEVSGKYIVLAHGANYIKANISGEKEYVGKGVHYCALCDGPLYKGGNIVVLGNGSLAAEEAVELLAYAGSVRIVAHNGELAMSDPYHKFLNEKRVEIVMKRAREIRGNGHAQSLIVDDGSTILFDGLFIALGVASSLNFAQQLGLETQGDFIRVDERMRTSNPKIWAVGMAKGGVNQVVTSVGDGGVAAVDMIKTIKGLPQYIDHT